jgi:hypothetical protein
MVTAEPSRTPEDVGHYIPETTENTDPRCITVNGQERCKTPIQTNNVEVDNRGRAGTPPGVKAG